MAYKIKKKIDTGFGKPVWNIYEAEKLKGKKNENELPIYKIGGKFYFRDKRLGEYRNVINPFDVKKENEVSLDDFQVPTEKDKIKLYGKKK
jgi:hypothetical protein